MAEDYNLRAAKGQAFNLAVAEAIKQDKTSETKFIYERFVHYFELGQLLQSASIDDIKKVLE